MNFAKWKDELETRCKAFLSGVKETISPPEPVVRFSKETIQAVFSGTDHFKGECFLRCPLCGNSGTHVRSAFARAGKDKYEGGGKSEGYLGVETRGRTNSRRDALCIGVDCEYGHSFSIVFQQCTGTEFIEVEVLKKDWEAMAKEEAAKCL